MLLKFLEFRVQKLFLLIFQNLDSVKFCFFGTDIMQIPLLLNPANLDVLYVVQPYVLVFVSEKLSLHLQHLNLPDFLKVIAHFVTLLHAVITVLLVLKQLKLLRELSQPLSIANLLGSSTVTGLIHVRKELNHDRLANPLLVLDTALHELKGFPVKVSVGWPEIEYLLEFMFQLHFRKPLGFVH